mgnify:CR=1 FL=1
MKNSLLFVYALTLSFIGLLFMSSASLFEAEKTIGDPYFFIKRQLLWLILGIIVMLITSKINLNLVKENSFRFYLLSTIFLILVLIPGVGVKVLGARRQIDLGFFNFQPSEFFKLASVIFFSYLFTLPEHRNISSLFLYLGLPLILIILEPNLSTTLLIALIVTAIYFLSGAKITNLFLVGLILTAFAAIFIFTSPYRLNRVKTLLQQQNNQDLSYHSEQIILSLASGGISGKGFANSDHKYKFLPKISTDSILAIIGEETGFIGLALITYLFLILISRLMRLSQVAKDDYEKLLVGGIAVWIALQGLINFAAIVALIPLTGIPFPFIAYGGSSLINLFAALGLTINIEKKYSQLLYSNHDRHSKNPAHWHSHHSRR